MKCEKCQEQNLVSNVYPGMCYTTQSYYEPFYDENGKYHNHDGNVSTTPYRCSNNHSWTICSSESCWCGWGK